MTSLRRLMASMLVAAFAFVSVGSLAHAAASGSLCDDTRQLQSWFAQDFTPGVDQYQQRANADYVNSLADYLHKLADEAPAAAKHDLTLWAVFTSDVASGASESALAQRASAVKAAVGRVKTWLADKSGCDKLYVVKSSGAAGSHTTRNWVIGIIAVVAVLSLLSIAGGGGSTSRSSGVGLDVRGRRWPERRRFLVRRQHDTEDVRQVRRVPHRGPQRMRR